MEDTRDKPGSASSPALAVPSTMTGPRNAWAENTTQILTNEPDPYIDKIAEPEMVSSEANN